MGELNEPGTYIYSGNYISNDFSNVHISVVICLPTSEVDYMLLEDTIHRYSTLVLEHSR